MNSRHLVYPELLPLLDFLPPLELSLETLEAVRAAGWSCRTERAYPPTEDLTTEAVPLAGRGGLLNRPELGA